ncbi:chryseobasin-related MNIO class RiPP peptide [Flavitalea flava]
MKLSKSLLSAILIGIAVQTTPSCKKDKVTPDAKTKKEAEKTTPPQYCPACGMG